MVLALQWYITETASFVIHGCRHLFCTKYNPLIGYPLSPPRIYGMQIAVSSLYYGRV